MEMKSIRLLCLAACLVITLPLLAQDPLSGTWTGDWGPSATHRNEVTLQLKWDGKALTGTVNPGPNAITLQKSTFDSKTSAIHLEADSRNMMGNGMVHFIIDDKLNGKTMTGSWNHGDTKGDFKIAKK